jgi:hypothetical protein
MAPTAASGPNAGVRVTNTDDCLRGKSTLGGRAADAPNVVHRTAGVKRLRSVHMVARTITFLHSP